MCLPELITKWFQMNHTELLMRQVTRTGVDSLLEAQLVYYLY
jgi:hypothetical protein